MRIWSLPPRDKVYMFRPLPTYLQIAVVTLKRPAICSPACEIFPVLARSFLTILKMCYTKMWYASVIVLNLLELITKSKEFKVNGEKSFVSAVKGYFAFASLNWSLAKISPSALSQPFCWKDSNYTSLIALAFRSVSLVFYNLVFSRKLWLSTIYIQEIKGTHF